MEDKNIAQTILGLLQGKTFEEILTILIEVQSQAMKGSYLK